MLWCRCRRHRRQGTGAAYSLTSSFSLNEVCVLGLGSSGGESPAWSLANNLAFHRPLNASTIATSARNLAGRVARRGLWWPPGPVVGVWEETGHATTRVLGVNVGVGGAEVVERYL